MATGTGYSQDPRAGGLRRITWSVLTHLFFLGVGFTGGVLYASRGPVPRPAPVEASKPTTKVREVPPPSSCARPAPEKLLTELAACVRDLSTRERKLAEEAEEGKIEYGLLRLRGCAADSPECGPLVARQKQIRDELKRLATELDDARGLETAIHRILSERAPAVQSSNEYDLTLQRARSCVLRHKSTGAAISWDEPEAVMGSKSVGAAEPNGK